MLHNVEHMFVCYVKIGEDEMNFSELAQIFSEIEPISGRLQMTKILSELFQNLSAEEAKVVAYLLLGELDAQYIGTQFNLAEKQVLKSIARLLDLSDEQATVEFKTKGDLGALVAEYNWSTKADLSILQVYEQLIKIAHLFGVGAQELKQTALYELLLNCDSLSAKYIVRIVVGTMRLGFSDMTIIDALSQMLSGDKSLRVQIEHAYSLSADIGRVVYVAKENGIDGIRHMKITVGIPIRPAAAEREPTASAIIEKIGPCIAQPKLDGFRLQVHVKRTEHGAVDVKFFSRNLLDMSAMFPELTQAFQNLSVQTLICEGEAIVYDEQTDTYASFQETVKRRRKHDVQQTAENLPLRLILFDILYCNGQELLSEGSERRRTTLMSIFKVDRTQVVSTIEERFIKTSQELEAYFVASVSLGFEGLVVKKPNATYQPGKRNFNWIKLKRQEGQLNDTIDTVILGYYAGQGKRASFGIGAFLIGVFNPQRDHFQTVAKIGTGLKDAQWIELKQKCDAIKVIEKPKNIECVSELTPDVWVAPKIVCEVRADEITRSPVHSANKTSTHLGLALRFPRFVSYREDKSSTQATSSQELKELFDLQYQNQKNQ